MSLVVFSLRNLGHRLEETLVVTGDDVSLFLTNLRIVTRNPDVNLRALRPEIEVHHQREIGLGDAATTEHFNIFKIGDALQNVEVNVVEASIKQSSTSVLALNLRQRVTTVRQQFAFSTKYLRHQLFPRTSIKR